jgi:dihydrofolate reductase
VSRVIWHVTMSLDGFIAGPDDSMDWVVAQWSDGGENTRNIDVQRSAVADEVLQRAGAILGGRRWYDVAVRKFDGYEGIYGGQWTGPVFVLTHRPPGGGSLSPKGSEVSEVQHLPDPRRRRVASVPARSREAR